MTDKQINKWLRRQFSPIGWALVLYYVLMNILAMVTMLWEAVNQLYKDSLSGNFMREMDMDAVAGNAWGFVAAILVAIVVLHAWKGPEYWRKEIFVKEKPMTAGVFFPVLCLCVGSQMVNSLWIGLLELIMNQFDQSVLPMLESVSGDSDTFSMFLYASILAPIAEEVLFRGCILRTLRPFGKKFAVFGSAFLFGLFHGNLLQTPYAFLIGLVLGYVTVEYSIGWSVVLHMFNNLVLADLMTRLTANLPPIVYEVLSLVILGGCMIASGVILVLKRREIASYIRSEWMDRRVLKCFFLNAGIIVLTLLMIVNMAVFFAV